MEMLNRVARYLNSEHPRTPGTLTEYLAGLPASELLAVSVAAQIASERLARSDAAQSAALRQVAAMAADVIDVRQHDRDYPGSPWLPGMLDAAGRSRSPQTAPAISAGPQ